MEPQSVTDFYTEIVLPQLQESLDRAFPEFGWRRDGRGWVATNEEHTHARLGARAARVVAHGPAPRGFLVHGGEATLWTAYINGGAVPRGEAFVRAVEDLGRRAGVDLTPIERPVSRDPRAEVLRSFFDLCRHELASERGAGAAAYLERRGFPASMIESSGLGLVPPAAVTRAALTNAGHSAGEIDAAGVLADSRWPGRLCGAWRDERGRIATLWARTLAETGTRYLYLRGATRSGLPPYGLTDVLSAGYEARRDLVLVEGVMDVHQLRAHGIENAAALGGLSITASTFERLSRHGVERVTLCLDRDDPGRTATARAVEQSARATSSPALHVVDPERLVPANDPDELVREYGAEAWHALLERRECGITWRTLEFVGDIEPNAPAADRRAALSRAGAWLGTFAPRLALEQEDAVRLAATRCGYSPAAVNRAFRARYWTRKADLERSHSATLEIA
jgi:hypothetical protein